MQVVDHDHQGAAPGGGQEVLGHLLVKPKAGLGGIARGGRGAQSPGERHAQGLACSERGLVIVLEGPQDLDPGPVGRSAGRFGTAAPDHGHPLADGNVRRLLDQAGPADARLAFDEDHAAPALAGLHHPLGQASQLRLAPDHRRDVADEIAGWAPRGHAHQQACTERPRPGSGMVVRGRPEHGPPQVQGDVLADDGLFQATQVGAGFEPELVAEDLPATLVGPQGVGLATTSVEGQHPLTPQALPEGMLADQALELGDGAAVAPLGQPGIDAVLSRLHLPFHQAGDRRQGEDLSGHVGQRISSPQGKGVGQDLLGLVGPACRQACLGLVDQGVEAGGVDVVWAGAQDVTGRLGDQDLGRLAGATSRFEEAAQLGHVGLQGARRRHGRFVAPELVDDAIEGHHPVGLDHQHGQQAAQLVAGQLDGPAVVGRDVERAEDAEVHQETSLRTGSPEPGSEWKGGQTMPVLTLLSLPDQSSSTIQSASRRA